MEHLAQTAGLAKGVRVLDVGCGFGGSSIYLARHYQAEVTGITISSVQVDLANKAAARAHVNAQFLLMDAETMSFDKPFDVVWSIESISHYQDQRGFFSQAAACLKPGGTLALIDWFKKNDLSPREHAQFIDPIENGMLVELHTLAEYEGLIRTAGFQLSNTEVLNSYCAKTWDICLELIRNKALWELAARRGPELLQFLQGFRAMRAGFRSGNFVYALMVAKKTET